MAHYTIRPIKVGSISYYRGAFTSNQEQYKEREEFPVLIFLIEGNGCRGVKFFTPRLFLMAGKRAWIGHKHSFGAY